jgi:RNA polymerase sigma factor (sigma-70 family)
MPAALSSAQFTDWTNQLRPLLQRVAARRCGEAEAPDIVQETLLRAWQRLARFDADGTLEQFRAWLLCILAYVCQDYRRAAALHPEILLASEDLPRREPLASDDASHRRSLFETLELAGLTDKQERCLRLCLDGCSQEEIAARLHIRQQTVAQHLAAARRKLAPLRSRYLFAGLGVHWFTFVSDVAIYRPPKGVWDREGNAAQRERRRARS